MTLAEKLKNSGLGKPNYTKEQLMEYVESHIRKGGYASFIIGTHVTTNFNRSTMGDCNPYNRQYLYKWLDEEGFNYSSKFNPYGVESIKITL